MQSKISARAQLVQRNPGLNPKLCIPALATTKIDYERGNLILLFLTASLNISSASSMASTSTNCFNVQCRTALMPLYSSMALLCTACTRRFAKHQGRNPFRGGQQGCSSKTLPCHVGSLFPCMSSSLPRPGRMVRRRLPKAPLSGNNPTNHPGSLGQEVVESRRGVKSRRQGQGTRIKSVKSQTLTKAGVQTTDMLYSNNIE